MRIVLITTSSNAVREAIEKISDVDLYIIDCAIYNEGTFAELKEVILFELEKYYSEFGAPDILLTYRCPCLIPRTLYSKARVGAFNLHPSLLPKYPGLNPWREIFRYKETESGVTIHALSEKPDSGDLIFQEKFLIERKDTFNTAREKADVIAAKLVFILIKSKLIHIRKPYPA